MTTSEAINILWDLGYSVASDGEQAVVVARTPLAARYDLPRGRRLEAEQLESFVFDAVCKAGCTALPTWC